MQSPTHCIYPKEKKWLRLRCGGKCVDKGDCILDDFIKERRILRICIYVRFIMECTYIYIIHNDMNIVLSKWIVDQEDQKILIHPQIGGLK